MKTAKISLISVLGIFILLLAGCQKDETEKSVQSNLPESFRIDVPSSLSQPTTQKSASTGIISGDEVYRHLNNFVYIGDAAAEIVENIIKAIRIYGLNKPLETSFIGENDYRTKNLVVLENVTFEGITWQHQVTITDAVLESNADGGIALQVFWNTSPAKGVAILRPAYWDVSDLTALESTVFRIDYSEAADSIYEATMMVTIYNWDLNLNDRFHMNNLKLFVGKAGDRIDVYGNSNHPDAWLFLPEPKGFDWAFVASCSASKNIAVAEVGLPPCQLNETSREVLLGTYSIQNVFTAQIREYVHQTYGVYPDEATLATYLLNTEAPAYFNNGGFVQGGVAPTIDYQDYLLAIQNLVPYNPSVVSNVTLDFKH